ncbi:hypothetical protein QTP86_001766 [Hemibagrus guttatus]|nr:hypothetical protein QTP86_001766 [Hemibagrus guttatus]
MSERSRTVVRCAVGQTEEFKVEVGLHQGSALSPFLFAIVMDQLSEEVRQESPWTMMFADDIVICSESREQVAENLERWRFALERRGMKGLENRTRGLQYNLQIKKAQAMLSKELPVAVAQDVCSQSSRNMSTQTTRRILDHQHLAPNDHSPTELYMNKLECIITEYEVTESIPKGERVVIGADFNGHVGDGNRGDEEVMGKFGVKVDSIQRKRVAKNKWDMDKTEENKQEYKELQRRVKREVSKAKQKAYDELYTRLDTREGEKDLYRLARQRDRDGKDVQQVRVIKDRDGRVLTSEESVQRKWKEYFEELMNEENERGKKSRRDELCGTESK